MKSPSVVHFRSLDTFALRGVAESYGSGAAGMRLTTEGLAAYVRASRRSTEMPPPAPSHSLASPNPPARTILETPEREEESIERFVRAPVRVTLAPSTPVRATRPASPSLATIELGLRKPTTWAVVLLTVGVAFGVVIARVATSARDPVANGAPAAVVVPNEVSWPARTTPAPAIPQATPTLPTTVIRAESLSLAAAASQAHASSTPTRAHRSSRARRLALLAATAGESSSGDYAHDTSEPREKHAAAPVATPDPAHSLEGESDDSVGAASAASLRAQRELSDSL